MTLELSNPHDAYFRNVLSNKANATSELRAILPAHIASLIDWTRLEPDATSYVDDELRSRYSDLVFRTRLVDGPETIISLLIEHQSTNDPFMARRVGEYLHGIWRTCAKLPLPLVIPVIVHCDPGGRRWTAATDLADLFGLPPPLRQALGDLVPRTRFLLDDLNSVTLSALYARDLTPLVTVMLALLKIAPGNPDLGRDIRSLSPYVGELDEHGLVPALRYIYRVSQTPLADLESFFEQLGPEAKETLMTTEEMILAEGEARGRAKMLVEMLVQQLTLRFGGLPEAIVDAIAAADAEQVWVWAERFVTASSLEDVFGPDRVRS